ncbi:MAG: hypothetical protein ACRCX2_13420 [Paraclostridium sp.]
MGEYRVCEFQKEYKMLTSKMRNKSEYFYKLGLLVAYASEIEKGYKVTKVLKANAKGTKVNYVPFKDNKDISEYIDMVKGMSAELQGMEVDLNEIEEVTSKEVKEALFGK